MPDGRASSVNALGVQYYKKLIDQLLVNGIQPAVTLCHFDLPQALQDIGGWLNPDIADIFAEYARVCFKEFGEKVKLWFTINEPSEEAVHAYGSGYFPPGIKDMQEGVYKGMHYILSRMTGGGSCKNVPLADVSYTQEHSLGNIFYGGPTFTCHHLHVRQ